MLKSLSIEMVGLLVSDMIVHLYNDKYKKLGGLPQSD